MSITERAEILGKLYQVNADLGILLLMAQRSRALALGIQVVESQNLILDEINKLEGRAVELRPRQLSLVR